MKPMYRFSHDKNAVAVYFSDEQYRVVLSEAETPDTGPSITVESLEIDALGDATWMADAALLDNDAYVALAYEYALRVLSAALGGRHKVPTWCLDPEPSEAVN